MDDAYLVPQVELSQVRVRLICADERSAWDTLMRAHHYLGFTAMVGKYRKSKFTTPSIRDCVPLVKENISRKEGPATVGIYSYTRQLGFAAFPGRNAEALFALVHQLYPETVLRSSVLETALANMNAVFHPSGMLMNAGWIESTGGDFLFYAQGMTEGVGRVVSAIDAERMAVAKALGVPATSFLEAFHRAGLTTNEAMDSGSVARACRESEPNRTIRSPPSLDHRYVREDVGFGLVPFSALGRLAGVPTPSIDAHIYLLSLATGIDYATIGLDLDKLGLAGKQPEALQRFLMDGD